VLILLLAITVCLERIVRALRAATAQSQCKDRPVEEQATQRTPGRGGIDAPANMRFCLPDTSTCRRYRSRHPRAR